MFFMSRGREFYVSYVCSDLNLGVCLSFRNCRLVAESTPCKKYRNSVVLPSIILSTGLVSTRWRNADRNLYDLP
jgi:hypothetical protein